MSYSVFILRRAQRELAVFPTGAREQAIEAIERLSVEPRPPGCRKLTAREGWRIRVGDYRVIYEIDDEASTVTVLHVGHRRDIYRQ